MNWFLNSRLWKGQPLLTKGLIVAAAIAWATNGVLYIVWELTQ